MSTFRCPDNVRHEGDIKGCGAVFEAEPDDEGLVDCFACGIWFRADEPGVRVDSKWLKELDALKPQTLWQKFKALCKRSPCVTVSSEEYRRRLDEVIYKRRQDPHAAHTVPFPVTFAEAEDIAKKKKPNA